MRNIARSVQLFVFLTILWTIILGIGELTLGRSELHLYLDQYHFGFADGFFKYATHLGSGWMALVISVILLFFKYRWGLLMGAANLIVALLTQTAKRSIFPDSLRPTALLPDQLYLVPGVEQHATLSFPSGHSATVFCIGMVLAIILPNRRSEVLLFSICAVVAFSRIYLDQHFAGDVAVGSFIGMTSAFIAHIVFAKTNMAWLNKGLINK